MLLEDHPPFPLSTILAVFPANQQIVLRVGARHGADTGIVAWQHYLFPMLATAYQDQGQIRGEDLGASQRSARRRFFRWWRQERFFLERRSNHRIDVFAIVRKAWGIFS